jgi:hypothetical protein
MPSPTAISDVCEIPFTYPTGIGLGQRGRDVGGGIHFLHRQKGITMKSKNHIPLLAAAALLFAMGAHAGPPETPPGPKSDTSTATAVAGAAALAGAAAVSGSNSTAGSISGGGDALAGGGDATGGNATGGQSDATGGTSNATGGASDATAQGGAAAARQGQVARGGAGGEGGAGGSANGVVDVDGDQNTYRSRALAVSLPGLVAAPAVPGECRIHTRGVGAFSAGVTGGTKLDKGCMDRQHCLNLADRLAAWGYVGAAARQLAACDGVTLESTDQVQRAEGGSAHRGDQSIDMSKYPTREEVVERDRRIIEAVSSK